MRRRIGPPLDQVTFEKMRRIAPNFLANHRNGSSPDWRPRTLPEELAFKLTNRCDLRCTHCYQWNDTGYHHDLNPSEKHGDLPLSVVAKTLTATKDLKSNVYLWGGEPLLYRDWDGLIQLLAEDLRWTSICTNGILIKERLDSLTRISTHLEVSISIDGFEREHDSVRGKGSFQQALSGLRLLLTGKQSGTFAGEVTVNFVISDRMVSRMFDFVQFLEAEGVETVYLSFPWYISDQTAAKMDAYFGEHFSWNSPYRRPSWHSYTFKISADHIDELNTQIARIDDREWRLKVRYNPRLDSSDVPDFINGSDHPAQGKTRCHAIQTRMDVFPNGDVVSCKFFPEFAVGNLQASTFEEVWHGNRFNQVRETVSKCGLMPVCAKCNLLYTRGS